MTARRAAVVFDLDGTLLDSMPMILQMFGHAIHPFAQPLTEEAWRLHLGGPPRRILERVLADASHVDQALVRLESYQRSHSKTIAAFEGMSAILEDLERVNLPVGLWTGRDRESTLELIEVHKMGRILRVCICGDDLMTHKPDPEGLAVALRGLDADPAESVFVGDSEVDVLAGAALGVRTVWITHGLTIDSTVGNQAWRIVNTPLEAYEVIRAEFMAG
ncbi:MAG TPA: HAD-IA family hydrolase [Opitutus sp.]|nr:HAD-IA family hydrolase [Opitutus sp.]